MVKVGLRPLKWQNSLPGLWKNNTNIYITYIIEIEVEIYKINLKDIR